MNTKKSIKEAIDKQFNLIPRDVNWYANRYYNFFKVKKQVNAIASIDDDIITMSWENGTYKVKVHDQIDRAIMIPLLLNK